MLANKAITISYGWMVISSQEVTPDWLPTSLNVHYNHDDANMQTLPYGHFLIIIPLSLK